jgi:hypothetical protein
MVPVLAGETFFSIIAQATDEGLWVMGYGLWTMDDGMMDNEVDS